MRITQSTIHLTALAPLVLGSLLTATAHAQQGPQVPLWEAGVVAAGASQLAYPGASQQVNRALVLPFFVYRGKVLRVDQNTVGLRAVNTDTVEVDVGFGGAFGAASNSIEARKGMPDLGTLVEFGPRIKWKLGNAPGQGRLRAEVALRGVFDVSDQFRDKGLALEPELIFERRSSSGWAYSTSVGMVFGDERLAETFYGVAPAYATPDRAAFSARSGLLASKLSVNVNRALTPDLRVFGFARILNVDGGANMASPLVRQNTGGTLGLGLIYTFARSRTTTGD